MARYKCAWCAEKGIVTYLNDIEFEGDKDSHGICKSCADEMLKEFAMVKEYNDGVSKGKQTTIQKGVVSQVKKD
jgi:hypothetical protein